MNVGVAYAETRASAYLKIELDGQPSIRDAIESSGILERFPHLDLERHRVGIHGRPTPLDTPVRDGDRVEIYHHTA